MKDIHVKFDIFQMYLFIFSFIWSAAEVVAYVGKNSLQAAESLR